MKDAVMITIFDQEMKVYAIKETLPLTDEGLLDETLCRHYYDKYLKRVRHIFIRTNLKKVPQKVSTLSFFLNNS
jgi:hypothetical protein